MQRKIILKVKDLIFENTKSSVDAAYKNAEELLNLKGYSYDGILLSVDSKIAYAWKNSKTVSKPPQPPNRRLHA